MSTRVPAGGVGSITSAPRAGRGVPADNPEAYIPGDRRRAIAAGRSIPDRVAGSALFADISAFTQLTEALVAELGPQRGAEELAATLEIVFDAVLGTLHRFGGTVIYFSGDAVTCWINGDDGHRAAACGLEMQEQMARVGSITTPNGTGVRLGMKVAVSSGPARRFIAGDPDIQLIDVLAGSLMDRLAAAEHDAASGQVVLDPTTASRLKDRVAVLYPAPGGRAMVVGGLLAPPAPMAPRRGFPRLPRAAVRPWLLPPVYERMRTGRGEFLTELRPAVPMFVRFGGIEFDLDPDAPAKADDFIRMVQRVVDNHGGSLLQLTVGDKGAYLYAVFGSPVAHEDDAARACGAALDVLALEGRSAAQSIQIGIAAGKVRSGTYGSRQRRTFCCLGDAVNLAARLMSAAPQQQALATMEVERSCRGRFTFEDVGLLSVKGKAEKVAARRLIGKATDTGALRQYAGRALVGRADELALLADLADRASRGQGQVAALTAEPGTGKSHLASVVTEVLERRGVAVLAGAASSASGATSYLAWRPIVAQLLGVGDEGRETAALIVRAREALGDLGPDLLPRLPLLGAVFGHAVADTELTASFDAKLRKASLESLIATALSRRCERGPVTVVVEDCHWLDPLSRDLLDVVARSAAPLRLFVLVTYRPGPFAPPAVPHRTVLELGGLDDQHARTLLATRIERLWGAGTVLSERFARDLLDRAEGNPFFLEELARYLHDRGASPDDPDAGALELPGELSSLILSRIDTLAELPRRNLKVASVVGRSFSVPALTGAYPKLGSPQRVLGHLRKLQAQDLVVGEGSTDLRFAFKHAVIQEVAYESMPFSLRATVHGQLGFWLEAAEPEALDLLAYHFWRSRDEEKKQQYLLLAGEAAKARFANDAAVDYFSKLAAIVQGERRELALRQLGSVLEIQGDQAEAVRAYDEELHLVEARGDAHAAAWTRARRCTPLRRQGLFRRVIEELDAIEPVFDAEGDQAGLAKVAHLRGLVANQTAAPDEAWRHFTRSLDIRRSLGDKVEVATTLGNLGNAAVQKGDYDLGWELTEESLALRLEIGDRRNVSVSHNNLGVIAYLRKDYTRAMPHLEEAVRTGLEIGALYTASVAQHSLANCARDLGDGQAARRNYMAALRACATVGDAQWLAQLLEDVALLAFPGHPGAALELLGAADALRDQIGAPRAAFEEAIIEEHIGPSTGGPGRGEAAEARRRGGQLTPEDAARLASALCESGT